MRNNSSQFSFKCLLAMVAFAALVMAMAVNHSRQANIIKELEAQIMQHENAIAVERALQYLAQQQPSNVAGHP